LSPVSFDFAAEPLVRAPTMHLVLVEAYMANAIKEIEWKRDLDAELKAANKSGHHVLLDFSAAPM
jgi:hypothetical protein